MSTLRGTSVELLKVVALFARCHFRYNDVHGNDVSSIDVRSAYAKAVRKIVTSTTPRVLLIMQGKLRCRAYAVMLSTFGIQCTCSSNAMDAYRQYLAPRTRVAEPEFNLIVTEWGAGETTATDLMKFLKDDGNEHFCIVALCGKDVLAGTAIRSGVDLFFRKPLALHLGVIRQLLLPRSMAIQGFPVALLRRPANHSQLKAVFDVHVDDEPIHGASFPTAADVTVSALPVVTFTQSTMAGVDKLVREIQDEVEADEMDVDQHSEEFVDQMLSYLKAHQPRHANERWHTHLQNSMQALDHARKAVQRLNDEVSACRKQAEYCWKYHGDQSATAEQSLNFVGLSRFHLISRILTLSQRNETLLSQISAREAELRNFQDDTASLTQSVNALLHHHMSGGSNALNSSASDGKPPRRTGSSREIKKLGSMKGSRNGAGGASKPQRRASVEKLTSTPLAASLTTIEFPATPQPSRPRGWSASVTEKIAARLETTLMEFEDGLAERWQDRDIPAQVSFHLAWPPKPLFSCNTAVYQAVRTTLEQLMVLCTVHSRQVLAAAPVTLRSLEEFEERVYHLLGTNPADLFHEANALAGTAAVSALPSQPVGKQPSKAGDAVGPSTGGGGSGNTGAAVKERKSVVSSSSAANLAKQRSTTVVEPLNLPQPTPTTSFAADSLTPTHRGGVGNATTKRIMSKNITELQAYVFQFMMRDVRYLGQRVALSLLRQRYHLWLGFTSGARRTRRALSTAKDFAVAAETPPPPTSMSSLSSPKDLGAHRMSEPNAPSPHLYESHSTPLQPPTPPPGRKTEDSHAPAVATANDAARQPSFAQSGTVMSENLTGTSHVQQPLAPEAPKQARGKATSRGSVAAPTPVAKSSSLAASSNTSLDMPQVAKLRV